MSEPPTPTAGGQEGAPGTGAARPSRVRLGAIVAVALAAGLVTWLLIEDRDTPSSTPPLSAATTPSTPATTTFTGVRALSPEKLSALSRSLAQPIYWAGPKKGFTYEVTRTAEGNIYIRYLPPGVAAGAKQAKYLLVATYPFPNAYDALENVAGDQGLTTPNGGLALVDAKYPQSVHLAYPGVAYQIEVYDPSPARSLAVARSGGVQPVP